MYSSLAEVEVPEKVEKLLRFQRPVFYFELDKINDHFDSQRRIIVLTRNSFFNIKRNWLGTYSVQKEISIDNVIGLIHEERTNKFVVRFNPVSSIPKLSDYQYIGNCGYQITGVLLQLLPSLRVWSVPENMDLYINKKRRVPLSNIEMMEQDEQYKQHASEPPSTIAG